MGGKAGGVAGRIFNTRPFARHHAGRYRPVSWINMPPSTSKNYPLDALWQGPTIIWVLLAGEGLAIVLALAPGMDGNRLTNFGLTSLMVQWVSLLTLGGLYLLRNPLAGVRPHYVAYVALLLLVLATWLVCGSAWLFLRDAWSTTKESWQSLVLRFTGIAVTVGLLGLGAFQNHWRTRQLAVLAKQAEVEALQARIRPHFLFNTLNTCAALVHRRPADAEQLLLDLADLFRAALAGPQQVSLENELALARRYLEIESLRFGERLQVAWRMPDVLPEIEVPTLSIQPLVENAIRHGVEPSPTGGLVEIEIIAETNWVWITVRNGLPPGVTQNTTGHQVGLNSVRARINALSHGRGYLKTETGAHSYTAMIVLPLQP